MHLFGDATRVRLMHLLAREELSVAELTSITELPQSRVSTHLGKLREAGVVRDRRVRTSTFYTLADPVPEDAARVWALVRNNTDDAVLQSDRRRLDAFLAARDADAPWADAVAGRMERHYSPGRTWEATARGLLGFIHFGRVLDVGSGDGAIAELLAPHAGHYTALDRSERVIEAARRRLETHSNVQFVHGDMHELPFSGPEFDQVLLFNSLPYSHNPARALEESVRVLVPGGLLAIITLNEHPHSSVVAPYNHRNNGFAPETLRSLLAKLPVHIRSCDVTSREARPPYFEVVTAFCQRHAAPPHSEET